MKYKSVESCVGDERKCSLWLPFCCLVVSTFTYLDQIPALPNLRPIPYLRDPSSSPAFFYHSSPLALQHQGPQGPPTRYWRHR